MCGDNDHHHHHHHFSLLYLTHQSQQSAQQTIKHLLEQKLIVSANIFSTDSMHLENGQIKEGPEVVSVCKTLPYLAERARVEVLKTETPDVPSILILEADPNDQYLAWTEKQLE